MNTKGELFKLYHIIQEAARDAEQTAKKLKAIAEKLKEEYEKHS